MIDTNIQIALITAGAVLLGALIGVGGQIIGNLISHKKEIERIRNEFVLKEKIESFKKIYGISCEIKRKLIEFITNKEKNKTQIHKLISELNNEFFLFSDKKTLIKVRESINIIQNILEYPPKIINLKNEDFKKTIKLIGDSQIGIIKPIREELKI